MRCFLAKEKALSKELELGLRRALIYFNERLGVKREIHLITDLLVKAAVFAV
jgi:hypothetical protein